MFIRKTLLIVSFVLLWVIVSYVQPTGSVWFAKAAWAAAMEESSPNATDDVEVMTRGPIHEAFAQPISLDSEESIVVTKQPPELIEEIPPDEKPEGENVLWIPGYWSWDEDLNDFLWVSGCWRAVPPGNSWVPGYWNEVEGGYEWISGFWTSEDTKEIEYLPAPPETLEAGPSVSAPSAYTIWVPGCWVWKPGWLWFPGRYAWRPGYWLAARPDWVWVPAHYVYTPHGCVFVAGYWDYTLERRGVAFSPLYFPNKARVRIGWRVSPAIAINVDILIGDLFCGPRCHHYYFGDYYAVEYERRGIYPWYQVREYHRRYDPIYVHQRWMHRNNHNWLDDLRSTYKHRRNDPKIRPARTYKALEKQIVKLSERDRRDVQVARPLKKLAIEKNKSMKVEAIGKERHEQAKERSQKLRVYKEERVRWESPSRTSGKNTKRQEVIRPKESPTARSSRSEKERTSEEKIKPRKVKISRSPITVNRKSSSGKESTPPPRPKQPRFDSKAKPKTKK